jgi:hypothetical protein
MEEIINTQTVEIDKKGNIYLNSIWAQLVYDIIYLNQKEKRKHCRENTYNTESIFPTKKSEFFLYFI